METTGAAGSQRRGTRACEACRRRKVRCNGEKRCQQCSHLNLKCVYSTNAGVGPSRKHSAQRGSVIQAYRKDTTAAFSPPKHVPLDVAPAPLPSPAPTMPSATSPVAPPFLPMHPDPSFFLDLIPHYLTSVYPVHPVITEADIHAYLARMDTDTEAASLLYAFAAVTINLVRNDFFQSMPGIREQIEALLTRCFEHRKPMSLSSQPTVARIMTTLFIEISLMGLRKTDLGLLYLREAISQVIMMHMDDADSMAALDVCERSKRQRAYWECFIHERFSALTEFHPVLLDPLPGMPDHDPAIPASLQHGWNYLIQTFLLVDREFVDYWRGTRTDISAEWVRRKHRQLEDEQWQIEVPNLPAMQQADIIITRQWLRTVTWQMAISHILLSMDPEADEQQQQQQTSASASSSTDALPPSSLSLTLPLRLSTELRQCLNYLSPTAVGIHGSGILHKLFEITNAIVDVALHLPQAPTEDTLQRVDDLLFLKKFLFAFPRIDATHKRILSQKFEKIKEAYPTLSEIDMLVVNSPLSTTSG